jgi:hypothetical protein
VLLINVKPHRSLGEVAMKQQLGAAGIVEKLEAPKPGGHWFKVIYKDEAAASRFLQISLMKFLDGHSLWAAVAEKETGVSLLHGDLMLGRCQCEIEKQVESGVVRDFALKWLSELSAWQCQEMLKDPTLLSKWLSEVEKLCPKC